MDSLDTLYTGRYLRLVKRGNWEYVERINCTGVVVIVPVTEAGEIVLVEQHRVPVASQVIELPAGLVGDHSDHDGEDFATAARRELHEETGFEADHIELLAAGPPTAGLATELVDLCLATGLRRTGPGGGVHDEDIRVHVQPLDGVDDWLRAQARAGTLVDSKVYAGLYFAHRRQSGGDTR